MKPCNRRILPLATRPVLRGVLSKKRLFGSSEQTLQKQQLRRHSLESKPSLKREATYACYRQNTIRGHFFFLEDSWHLNTNPNPARTFYHLPQNTTQRCKSSSIDVQLEFYSEPAIAGKHFKKPPFISYKRRKSLKDMLVKAKL